MDIITVLVCIIIVVCLLITNNSSSSGNNIGTATYNNQSGLTNTGISNTNILNEFADNYKVFDTMTKSELKSLYGI